MAAKSQNDQGLFGRIERAMNELEGDERDKEIGKLRAQVAELERAVVIREQMLAIMAHELRTPITIILMSARALLFSLSRLRLVEDVMVTLSRISITGDRMEHLIESVSRFAELRRGSIVLRQTTVNIHEVAAQVITELCVMHPGCKVVSERRGDGVGEWDPMMVRQVLSNLVRNALTHGDSKVPVRVTTRDESDTVITEVRSGGEIPLEAQKRIFEPFQHVDVAERVPARRGLGLGLYIVREIVRAHGGEVTFVSESSVTTFTVRLPRKK